MIRFVDAPPTVKTEIVSSRERSQSIAVADTLAIAEVSPAAPPTPVKRGRGRPRKEAKPS